jgi:small subunit ribosomal protein S18
MFDKKARKSGRFADIKLDKIDYKDERLLRKFITERGKIIPRRVTGVSAKTQRRLSRAIKRARIMALLPFVEETFK